MFLIKPSTQSKNNTDIIQEISNHQIPKWFRNHRNLLALP